MTKYMMQEAWKQKYTDEKAISAGTAYDYAHELETKDIVTSRPVEDGGRGVEYCLIDFGDSGKKLLDIKNVDKKILAHNVQRASLVCGELTDLGLDGVVAVLWDAKMQTNIDPQMRFDHETN